jgi:integrase
VGELLDQWFARGSTRWSPTTVRNLRSITDRHLKSGPGDVLVGAGTTAMVDDFYEKLRVKGRSDGKPLAVGSVRRVHSTLHAALAQAERWSWVFENVAERASPPKGVQAEMRPPTAVEVARLLESVAESDAALHLYLIFAAMTGARRGQLLAMRWVDVDLVVGAFSIQRAVVEGPDGRVLVPTKTRRSWRVALDEASFALLRAHHERVASSEDEDRFVFAADPERARPWMPNFVTKRFIDARRAAGLDHFRLRDLRHSWRPRCSTQASRCRSSPPASPTPVHRRR